MNLENKKVLITGADGFIGSHLTERVLSRCSSVRALCQYNSFQSLGWLDHSPIRDEVEILSGDIRDPSQCREMVEGIDVVFHLAALIGIPYSYQAPHSYVDTNIKGTLNLLEASRKIGIERFLQTSTSEVYGTAQTIPMTEHHPLYPQSPYAATKVGSDALAMSYYLSYSMPVLIARPFNTYGPRQSIRAVLPTIIVQALEGQKEIRLGKCSPTRDFTFVQDTCEGMIELVSCDEGIGEVVQIGTGEEISIGNAAKYILEIMGKENIKIVTDEKRLRPEASEVERLVCDPSKLEKLTGFRPIIFFGNGIEKMVEWFSNPKNLALYDAGRYGV